MLRDGCPIAKLITAQIIDDWRIEMKKLLFVVVCGFLWLVSLEGCLVRDTTTTVSYEEQERVCE